MQLPPRWDKQGLCGHGYSTCIADVADGITSMSVQTRETSVSELPKIHLKYKA